MLGCCSFLPYPCVSVATPLGSSEEQKYSLALPHSVYFSPTKISCLHVSVADDSEIQSISVRLPNKPDATDRNRAHLFVPDQQQENVEDICVPSAFDQFLDMSFLCTMCCQLVDPDNITETCNSNSLKITPSGLRTVGTRLLQNYSVAFRFVEYMICGRLRNQFISTR